MMRTYSKKTRAAIVVVTYLMFLVGVPTIQVTCCCDHHHIDNGEASRAYFSAIAAAAFQKASGSHSYDMFQIPTIYEHAVTKHHSHFCYEHHHELSDIDNDFHLVQMRPQPNERLARHYLAAAILSDANSTVCENPVYFAKLGVPDVIAASRNTTVLLF